MHTVTDRLRSIPPRRRRRLYQLAATLGAVAIVYGLASPDEVDAWLAVAAAGIALAEGGLAVANTDVDDEESHQ